MNRNMRFWLPAIVIAMTIPAVSLMIMQTGCKKEDKKEIGLPMVGDFWYRMGDGSYRDPVKITETSISATVEILDDGGEPVTERGLCWSNIVNPTIAGNKTSDGTGTGEFTGNISGLLPSGYYFLRAYATNSLGTAYGRCLPVHTFSGTMKDIDSNTYYTIVIGTLEWMGENLRTRKLSDGTPIHFETNMSMWHARNIPAYCYYHNDSNYRRIYGALYNGYAVQSGKLCPSGWHVPSYAEWHALISYLGDSLTAGAKMKKPGVHVWDGANEDATNESGFTALPGGLYVPFFTSETGGFSGKNTEGDWWSGTPGTGDSLLYAPFLLSSTSEVFRSFPVLEYGISVRCVKD
jgi:uncharacterized protein (TIGR02145 family)